MLSGLGVPYRVVSTAEGDRELLEALRRGEARSLAALYQRYGGKMLGFARRFVADQDAAEDVVIDLFRRWLEHPPRVQDAERLSAFLATSVYHAAVDWVRRDRAEQGQTPRLQADPDTPGPGSMVAVGQDASREVLQSRLARAMAHLSSQDRALLETHYGQALTTEECMTVLQVSRAAFHQRLHRARERLGRLLAEEERRD